MRLAHIFLLIGAAIGLLLLFLVIESGAAAQTPDANETPAGEGTATPTAEPAPTTVSDAEIAADAVVKAVTEASSPDNAPANALPDWAVAVVLAYIPIVLVLALVVLRSELSSTSDGRQFIVYGVGLASIVQAVVLLAIFGAIEKEGTVAVLSAVGGYFFGKLASTPPPSPPPAAATPPPAGAAPAPNAPGDAPPNNPAP